MAFALWQMIKTRKRRVKDMYVRSTQVMVGVGQQKEEWWSPSVKMREHRVCECCNQNSSG